MHEPGEGIPQPRSILPVHIGLYWLDILDHYINNYTVLIDGLLEAICVSWVWGYIKNVRQVLLSANPAVSRNRNIVTCFD